MPKLEIPPGIVMSQADRAKLLAWVESAKSVAGPHPILLICGEKATGKTRLLREIMDCLGVCGSIPKPRDIDDLIDISGSDPLVAVDGVEAHPEFLLDGLVLLSRGGSHAVRRLYTDAGTGIEVAPRPVAITSLGLVENRRSQEFLSRCTTIQLLGA